MMLRRLPGPRLRPFVATLWASDEAPDDLAPVATRERVLPTGTMHLVLRLSETPLRVFDGPDGAVAHEIGHGVVGGARTSAYVRDLSQPVISVGAQLHPGAAELVLGVPADELAERHTPLADLWGRSCDEAVERLRAVGDLGRRLDLFESILAARLPRVRGLQPEIAQALARFAIGGGSGGVGTVVEDSGYSHRRFIALFRRAVGLTPKVFWRVRRFQRAIARIGTTPESSLAELALDEGYSDQSHLNREFRAFAGLTPRQYRELAPASGNHVPIVPRRRG